jgi:hypothetical protein
LKQTDVLPANKPLLLKMKLSTILFGAILFFSTIATAQANISGVVNTYYHVVEVISSKACVRLNTTAGFTYNDKAMLVQMKGASIITATNSTFGDTTSLNLAGNYEIATVCYTSGDSVFFVYGLLNQYNVADKVQLVKIPQYAAANVTDTLKAQPWNNTTGTGGVLAIWVDGDLKLDAPISADSMGYRGGTYRLSNNTCTDALGGASAYAYNPTSSTQNGAYKGEGVADVSPTLNGGRGAPANGGGGGNNHNNGGAGGANLNAGGDGGGNSSTTGCTLALVGKGGKPLNTYGGRKIFMGGGGGAGHTNNGLPNLVGGGSGGGIVFIRANNLIGNGQRISADGQAGGPSASDGAGGAGAGGTVIMTVTTYTGGVSIEADGAQGGTANDGLNLNRCYGAGGGGSGGAIYFSGAIPAFPVAKSTNGGAAGLEILHDGSCAAAILPTAGINGQAFTSYAFRSSSTLATNNCSSLLPIDFILFKAQYSDKQSILTWTIAHPELMDHFTIERSVQGGGWIAIENKTASDAITLYSANDPSVPSGYVYYRLKMTKKSGSIAYSSIQKIYVASDNDAITVYPNPAHDKLFITGNSSPDLIVVDIEGKLIWKKKITPGAGTISLDLPPLAKGIYILRLGSTARKLIIQ